MIVLRLLARTAWLDLGPLFGHPAAPEGQEPEVGLLLRSLSATDFRLAHAAAQLALREARGGLAALKPYGLAGRDATGRMLRLDDPAEMTGAGSHIGLVEAALRGVVEWRGILTEDRLPAPLTRETLSALLQDDRVASLVQDRLDALSRLLACVEDLPPGQDPPEGNVSGASPSGSSEPDRTASAPTTAPAAAPAESPAPTASPAVPAGSARKPRTPRAPRKAPRSGASCDGPGPGPAAG